MINVHRNATVLFGTLFGILRKLFTSVSTAPSSGQYIQQHTFNSVQTGLLVEVSTLFQHFDGSVWKSWHLYLSLIVFVWCILSYENKLMFLSFSMNNVSVGVTYFFKHHPNPLNLWYILDKLISSKVFFIAWKEYSFILSVALLPKFN